MQFLINLLIAFQCIKHLKHPFPFKATVIKNSSKLICNSFLIVGRILRVCHWIQNSSLFDVGWWPLYQIAVTVISRKQAMFYLTESLLRSPMRIINRGYIQLRLKGDCIKRGMKNPMKNPNSLTGNDTVITVTVNIIYHRFACSIYYLSFYSQ